MLYTTFSSSPLPLISKIFGDDVSRCLHEITASDQGWVLSGHISGPADVFCTKVKSLFKLWLVEAVWWCVFSKFNSPFQDVQYLCILLTNPLLYTSICYLQIFGDVLDFSKISTQDSWIGTRFIICSIIWRLVFNLLL